MMKITDYLSAELLIPKHLLLKYIKTAPYRYKEYTIPKRSGKGVRVIAQPASVLKTMQRMVRDKFLLELPVHDCAMAYREGLGIKDNAQAHLGNEYLLKMDFSDFFPSIVPADLEAHMEKWLPSLSRSEYYYLGKIFFWSRKYSNFIRLSIGAPSSPFISNTLMYEFDCILAEHCKATGIIYTRYADDLTFTTDVKGALFDLPAMVEDICRKVAYPRLSVNKEKTVFSSKKNNRHVTGLVLANDGSVSLGRQRKRYIRSLVHRFTLNQLEYDEVLMLRGLVSFARHIEPEFYASMERKYGVENFVRLDKA